MACSYRMGWNDAVGGQLHGRPSCFYTKCRLKVPFHTESSSLIWVSYKTGMSALRQSTGSACGLSSGCLESLHVPGALQLRLVAKAYGPPLVPLTALSPMGTLGKSDNDRCATAPALRRTADGTPKTFRRICNSIKPSRKP